MSHNGNAIAVILGNPAMVGAYRAGIPANGKSVPDGAKMAKVHWAPKQNTFFPGATVPGKLLNVDFMVKDGKRFADSGGWGYAVFEYDAASDRSSQAIKQVCRRRGKMPDVGSPATRRPKEQTTSSPNTAIDESRLAKKENNPCLTTTLVPSTDFLTEMRLDLTDLYAFPKPGDLSKSILIMNVHPSVSVNPPGPTTHEPFATTAAYELKIDTNGDAIADIAYSVGFSFSDGTQLATVRRIQGREAAGTSGTGEIVVDGAPVSTGTEARVTVSGDYRFFAGWRSDPFFFDTEGALSNLQFTGHDFFTEKDVCGIVLEVPNTALAATQVGIWHRSLDGRTGTWVQADRGARPSQSIFLTGEQKGVYLAGEPADDAKFVAIFAHSLEHTGGYSPEEARRVAQTLLPDLLPFEPGQPASYPTNGRALSDDVMDVFISVLTNGKQTGDGVKPIRTFSLNFLI